MEAVESSYLDIFCTAIEMKERKKSLYEEAMKSCPDQVGIETFGMLREAEADHIERLREAYEKVRKNSTAAGPDVCRLLPFEGEDKKALLRKVGNEYGKLPRACLDDVAAIEIGMQLENDSIRYFDSQLGRTTDPAERDFIEHIIAEEREHFAMLADLKFYYVDTENWFLEKGRQRLDGAGDVT